MGSPVSNVGDLPQMSGAAGSFGNFDIHTMNVTHLVGAGDTSARVRATTTSDTYFLQAIILSITTFEGEKHCF